MTAIDENLTREIGALDPEHDGRARIQDWFMHGLCRDLDPEEFFAEDHDAQLQTRTRCFDRSEEHTSELQSRGHLVCRLLLEKKKHTLIGGCKTSTPVSLHS